MSSQERTDKFRDIGGETEMVSVSLTAPIGKPKKVDDDLLKQINDLMDEKIGQIESLLEAKMNEEIANTVQQITNDFSQKITNTTSIVNPVVNKIRRAKIQSVSATYFTCKLLGSSGTETGGNLFVYPVEHLGTNNLSGDVWPKLAATDNIPIFQDVNGTWYTTFIFDDTSC